MSTLSDPAVDAADPGWSGRFSDGKTAAVVAVLVRLRPGGLEIGTGPDKIVWSYGGLETATPVARGGGDVLLSTAETPGATLFIADHRFTIALVNAAPHLTAGAQRWRYTKPLLAVGLAFLALVGAVWVFDLSPARTVANLLPDNARQALGRQVIASITNKRRVCADEQGKAALDRLMQRLDVAASDANFDVKVVDWKLLNAFAGPGEQIVVTRELIEKAGSPDEVAGVLAHEMGHGLERHPETALVRAIGIAAALEFLVGGSSGTLANIGATLAQLSYTRAAEREADAHSLRILQAAGIAPRGIVDFFTRVEKSAEATGKDRLGQLELLRTHPQSAERARTAAERPAYPATPALSAEDWQALRRICG